ncbi:MAG: glycosyltransferase family 9 protein [Actinomycetota bacterium]|nr:glycosyltransferase family 9 protein [Actinomycetota bacterium]
MEDVSTSSREEIREMDDGQPNGSDPAPTGVVAAASSLSGADRVLAVRLDNVGDVVMLGPALRALRRHLPHVHLTLLASPGGSQAAPLLPWVDEVMVERVVWQDAGGRLALDPARELALVGRIAERQFDAALVFTSFSQSPWPPAYACYLAGVPRRAAQAGDFGGSLLTDVVAPMPTESHQVDRNLHLVEALGVPLAGRHLEIAVPTDADERATLLLAEAGIGPGVPFVALAPAASCPARRYPPERFAAVAASLAGAGWPVVVLGSAAEAELTAPILEATAGRPVVSLVGRTSVPELAAVLGRAALVLANDSGPMHLADALRIPLVVLFSGTDVESQWRPRTVPSRLLRRATTCSPCYRFTCPYDLACLDIPPEEVVAHALDLLGPGATRPGGVCVRSGS